jgi:type II secretory ATPase GspE/PulE/Tfp pilus assembly ATPase PilB-like protein
VSLGSDAEGRLAEAVLRDALVRRAEAVRLDPEPDGLALRLRVDGVLHEKPHFKSRLPAGLGSRLVARWESVAGISPGAARKACIKVRLDGAAQVLHIMTCARPDGHRLIMRPVRPPMALESLGLAEADVAALSETLAAESGLILIGGPPHSGRTTTLRAMAAAIQRGLPGRGMRRILAIDPRGEFAADRVARLDVGAASGRSLAWAIRACAARTEPVFVVDEIRDGDAVAASLEAALAGRLVLASVPSGDRWPDPTMVVAPEVDPLALSSALLLIAVQRLVRIVCSECRRMAPVERAAVEAVGFGAKEAPKKVAVAKGCPTCYHTGYAGRTALFSGLRASVAEGPVLCRESDAEAVGWPARALATESLDEAGRGKIRRGVTTPEEVLRVLGTG